MKAKYKYYNVFYQFNVTYKTEAVQRYKLVYAMTAAAAARKARKLIKDLPGVKIIRIEISTGFFI